MAAGPCHAGPPWQCCNDLALSQLTLIDDLPDPYQAPGAPGSQPAH